MPDGREVSLYTIKNKNGLMASVTDLGAVWVRMIVPDKNGVMDDVMLGFDDAAGYLKNGPHFGSVVGRIANRTGKAVRIISTAVLITTTQDSGMRRKSRKTASLLHS